MWTPATRALVSNLGAGQALSDDQFRLLEPLIPACQAGRPAADDRHAPHAGCSTSCGPGAEQDIGTLGRSEADDPYRQPLPPGSCEYSAILDHEQEHVRITRETLEALQREARMAPAAGERSQELARPAVIQATADQGGHRPCHRRPGTADPSRRRPAACRDRHAGSLRKGAAAMQRLVTGLPCHGDGRPSADTARAELHPIGCSAHYAPVAKAPDDDGDATYVGSGTGGAQGAVRLPGSRQHAGGDHGGRGSPPSPARTMRAAAACGRC